MGVLPNGQPLALYKHVVVGPATKRPTQEETPMKLSRVIALAAAMMLPMVVPAFGQQETDPTWYDPWASQAVRPPAAKAVEAQKQPKVKVAAATQPKVKKQLKAQTPRPADQSQTMLAKK